MQFNPDGSLKVGGRVGRRLDDEANKMSSSPCIKLVKEVTRSYSPKECTLRLTISPLVEEGFVDRSFSVFSTRVNTTMKLLKISSSDYEVSVGGEFSRCRDCNFFVSALREGLSGNLIIRNGSCSFKGFDNM